jgi:hypothetical protein
MERNPRDYLNSVSSSIDPLKVNATVESAIRLAVNDPLGGLGSAIDVGAAIRDLINPASNLFCKHALTGLDAPSGLTSLSVFRNPYEQLSNLPDLYPFRGTLSTLASVAGFADGIRTPCGTMTLAGAIAIPSSLVGAGILGSNIDIGFSSARSIAATYLASAKSVFELESSVVRLRESIIGASSLGSTGLMNLPSISIIGSMQSNLASLSTAARIAWEELGRGSNFLVTASPHLFRSPAIELYATAHLASSALLDQGELISTDEEIEENLDEASAGLDTRLAALDENLVELYRGGLHAIERAGPDWQRQSM